MNENRRARGMRSWTPRGWLLDQIARSESLRQIEAWPDTDSDDPFVAPQFGSDDERDRFCAGPPDHQERTW